MSMRFPRGLNRMTAVALVATAVVVSVHAQSPSIADAYGAVARRIATASLLGNGALDRLHHLCRVIGPRLAGSPAQAKAEAWAVEELRRAGCDVVRREPCKVPVWVRGHARVEITSPERETLPVLALGGSVGTPEGGIEADVVTVRSFVELDRLGKENVRGKIVVYDVPWEGYGKTVSYRVDGAARAAALGAVGVLVRSSGFGGSRTPHTGTLKYVEGVAEIPAAALSFEDAGRIGKTVREGKAVRIRMDLGCRTLPDADGANIVGDYLGSEKPDEIVLLGAHLDSWDVGEGAQDDGGGVASVVEVPAVLKRLGLRPRRTIRIVLFTNEENGLRGARAYEAAHRTTAMRHVAAIENDGGVETPVGFGMKLPAGATTDDPRFRMFTDIVALLGPLGAAQATTNGGGADIAPLAPHGVPMMSINTVGTRYFEWHHTVLDTFEAVDPKALDAHVGIHAVLAYVLADMRETLR